MTFLKAIYKLNSYLTGNTLCLLYKGQPLTAVSLFCYENSTKHTRKFLKKSIFLNEIIKKAAYSEERELSAKILHSINNHVFTG
jgi:hypothetical protein